jgi:CRP-like cAMP-binding protein
MHELPNDVRNRIHADAYMTTHQPEEIVVRKGDRVDSWLGVAEGLLKISAVYRTGKVVMFTGIPKGSWVGEGSVLKRELRRYDIVAMRPSRVIHLPGSTFRWLIDTSLDFNRVIVTRLNERLGQFISMMEIDRLTDPVARVARAIGTLYNPTLNPDLGPQLGLSQTELGELIGISRQSVAAALRQLQSEGLLRAVYGGITVLKLACLQTYQERNS